MVDKVVTGMGCVSAAGGDVASMMQALYGTFPPACDAAQELFFLRAQLSEGRADNRGFQLIGHCAEQALAQAQLDGVAARRWRIGVSLGTTSGTTLVDTAFGFAFYGGENPHPAPFDAFLTGNPAQRLARAYDFAGPVVTLNNACTSGADAIGLACSWLDNDQCDIVVAGGGDQILDVIQLGFQALQLISPALCRPFDRARSGLTLGEGAGILIIENGDVAVQRGQPQLGRVCGYGLGCDGYHPTTPDPAACGLQLAILQALSHSGLGIADIGFINAHGTGTLHNDLIEGRLLMADFPGVPFYSIKGHTGHTLGGAGAIEAIASLCSLRDGRLPVSRGFTEIDPEIGAAPTRALQQTQARYALSTSLGFGGAAAALILGAQGV